jgi:site-specific DNA-methyltransferase (adenine-specific)
MGSITELMESIKTKGQIQPILVSTSANKEEERTVELVAGGRRLLACQMLGIDILCVQREELTNLDMRILELEENIYRKDLTPAEEANAIEQIHNIKVLQHGAIALGRGGEGWGYDNTAKLIGKSKATVSRQLQAAQIVKTFPKAKKATSLSEILKVGKVAERVISRASDALKVKANCSTMEHITLHHGDSREILKSLPDKIFNILCTDPPFGILIDKIAMSIGGKTGGENTSGFTFDDSKDNALNLYHMLAKESFRVTTDDAHAYIFVAPEFFTIISTLFKSAGWLVHVRPLIWIKNAGGQNNAPHCWPSSCYEMVLYARKKDSKLIKQGRPDWFQIPPLKDKSHPTEKPVEVLTELISRSCIAGESLLDPFAGSGSSLVAGHKHGLSCVGIELLEEAYNIALLRLQSEG